MLCTTVTMMTTATTTFKCDVDGVVLLLLNYWLLPNYVDMMIVVSAYANEQNYLLTAEIDYDLVLFTLTIGVCIVGNVCCVYGGRGGHR